MLWKSAVHFLGNLFNYVLCVPTVLYLSYFLHLHCNPVFLIAGKKGKKKGKGKTISLNDFLGDTQGPGIVKQIDWADEAEDEYRSVNNCESPAIFFL